MKQIYGIWFPESDTHFIDHVHKNGDYQRDTFQMAMSYVKEPKIFYDVGAHVGLWSLMAFRAEFKQIHTYEPNPKTYDCLLRNMQLIDAGCYVSLNPHGISCINKDMIIIEESPDNSGAVKLMQTDDKNSMAFTLSINDNSMHENISHLNIQPHECLVKIDTEGMEAECVLGMDKILYALRPVVCVEQRTNEDALKILRQMGMQIVQQVRKDYILTWKN